MPKTIARKMAAKCSVLHRVTLTAGELTLAVDESTTKSCVPPSVIKEIMKLPGAAEAVASCPVNDDKCLMQAMHDNFRGNPTKQAELAREMIRWFGMDGPTDALTWLSDKDISNIAEQVVVTFGGESGNDVAYLGVVMYDFAINPRTCPETAKPSTIAAGFAEKHWKHAFIVLNTDLSGSGGKHWCLMGIDAERDETPASKVRFYMRFYDPTGRAPSHGEMQCGTARPYECKNIDISDFYSGVEVALRGKFGDMFGSFKVEEFTGRLQHREDSSNCGVATCLFMILIAKGYSFDEIQRIKTEPDLLANFKQELFVRA